ncbi:hypothetical protein Droror1_Dr00004929 [Drosera rotundifolia]
MLLVDARVSRDLGLSFGLDSQAFWLGVISLQLPLCAATPILMEEESSILDCAYALKLMFAEVDALVAELFFGCGCTGCRRQALEEFIQFVIGCRRQALSRSDFVDAKLYPDRLKF